MRRTGISRRLGLVTLLAAVVTASVFAATAFAAAPSNDMFANAQPIAGLYGVWHGSNAGATREKNEPMIMDSTGHLNKGGASIWFSWTAPATATATLTTHGSHFDTMLAVYTGTSVSALTLVASNDDVSSSDYTSAVSFAATDGTTYMVTIDGYNGSSGGAQPNAQLNWWMTGPGACILCVLGSGTSFQMSGGSTVSSARQGMTVYSTAGTAADISGGSTVTFTDSDAFVDIAGGVNASGGSSFTPSVTAFTPPSGDPDPLINAPVPTTPGPNFGSVNLQGSQVQTISQGTYSSLSANGNSQLTLNPGVYVITGGLQASGQATITGSGVELYFTNGAGIHLSGGSFTSLHNGVNGIVIFFARNNGGTFQTDDVRTSIQGQIYMKSGNLQVQQLQVFGRVVVNRVEVHSGGSLGPFDP